MTFKLYDVPGVDRPLLVHEDRAKELGYSEHVDDAMPSQRASKADWVAWAKTSGDDPNVIESMSKADLIEAYGGD